MSLRQRENVSRLEKRHDAGSFVEMRADSQVPFFIRSRAKMLSRRTWSVLGTSIQGAFISTALASTPALTNGKIDDEACA